MAQSVSKDLRDAADYIRQHGWIQGVLSDPKTGAMCAWGAVQEAADRNHVPGALALYPHLVEIEKAIIAALGLPEDGDDLRPTAEWNDAPGRTVDEVLAGLEAAAVWAESQVHG